MLKTFLCSIRKEGDELSVKLNRANPAPHAPRAGFGTMSPAGARWVIVSYRDCCPIVEIPFSKILFNSVSFGKYCSRGSVMAPGEMKASQKRITCYKMSRMFKVKIVCMSI